MFDKNLIDFHENFEAVSNLKTSIRHGGVCGTKASSVLDEAKSYVARMESITGMKFLATGTEETESWLSDSQKLRLRAERMSDAFSNLHPHVPLFNTKEQSEDLDSVYKALDFLSDKMKIASGIRLEAMRGGTPKQFNSIASVLGELQPYVSPRIRLESHGGSNWDSLKYRAEGVVSWISDKIKKLINWILGLFGFEGSKNKKDTGKHEKSPEEKKKDQEFQKNFAKTHQATKEQQIAIKKFVADLENEYGNKYFPAAYDAADRNYLKKVDVGEEKDPITKAKAKHYLDEAQKRLGKLFANNDVEDVSLKGALDDFNKQASKMLPDIDENHRKSELKPIKSLDGSFKYVVQANLSEVLLQKRVDKISLIDSHSFSEVNIGKLIEVVDKLIGITTKFGKNLRGNDPDEQQKNFDELVIAVTNVFNQRLPLKGGVMIHNSDYGHIYQFVNPNKCMAVAYNVDGGFEVLEHKFSIDSEERLDVTFDEKQKDTLIKLVRDEVEKFDRTDKRSVNSIEPKIKYLEAILQTASEEYQGQTTILFNILKIVGRLGMMRVEMVKYFDKLRGVSEDSFVVVI